MAQQELFAAKLTELAAANAALEARIAVCQTADHDAIRRERDALEKEWAATTETLRVRAKTIRFLTAQQLSQVQLEYINKTKKILEDALRQSWDYIADNSECDELALYAEYAIDFASLAARYALLAAVSAIDAEMEETEKKETDHE